MPSFAPFTLADNSVDPVVNHTYDPVSNQGTALFSDRAPERVANWPKLSADVKAATVSNGRSSSNVTMTFPVPVLDQEGCCVDLNSPEFIVYEVRVKNSNLSTDAQRKSARALFRAYVASAAFADVTDGISYY